MTWMLYGASAHGKPTRSYAPIRGFGNIVLGDFRTWTGKAPRLTYLAISPRTRMYQYSRSEGLFVGLGLTYIGLLGFAAQLVLMTLAWWNMYLSLWHGGLTGSTTMWCVSLVSWQTVRCTCTHNRPLPSCRHRWRQKQVYRRSPRPLLHIYLLCSGRFSCSAFVIPAPSENIAGGSPRLMAV